MPIKAWQLSRMIDATKLGRMCDSVLTSHVKTLRLADSTLIAKDSLLEEVRFSRNEWREKSELQKKEAENSKVIFKEGIKAERKRGWRKLGTGVIVGFVGAVLILSL